MFTRACPHERIVAHPSVMCGVRFHCHCWQLRSHGRCHRSPDTACGEIAMPPARVCGFPSRRLQGRHEPLLRGPRQDGRHAERVPRSGTRTEPRWVSEPYPCALETWFKCSPRFCSHNRADDNAPLLRYDQAVQGLVDNYVSLQGREVGECIYCGERDAPLSTEHAVPYGLNGPWTLLRASCAVCAKITSRFEHDAMRSLCPDVRNALAMQSRRRDKRAATLP